MIPEFLLFRPTAPLQVLRHYWQKWLLIAAGLLGVCLIFPPLDTPYGNMVKVADLLPFYGLVMAMYYGLALLHCLRFSKPDLLFWIIMFNALMMMKATARGSLRAAPGSGFLVSQINPLSRHRHSAPDGPQYPANLARCPMYRLPWITDKNLPGARL